MDSSSGTLVPANLWRTFAGNTAKVPSPNSLVYYFPQGHAAQASSPPNFPNGPHFPPCIPCLVYDVRLFASHQTDEVFAVLSLVPDTFSIREKPATTDFFADLAEIDSHAKVLTPSDSNNGGSFSVLSQMAESVFPKLDKSIKNPEQDLVMQDVHGKAWKFRHIYRGRPKRHLLTTGWSKFVDEKRLASGDTVVFARGNDGMMSVGLRRRAEVSQFRTHWLPPEDVVRAAEHAASGHPFQVVYYPNRGSAFCVERHIVDMALELSWVPDVTIRMTVEGVKGLVTGSVLSVSVVDPDRWPGSPWGLLEVASDRSSTRRVNPWSVESMKVLSPLLYNEQDKPSTVAENEKFESLLGPQLSTYKEHEMGLHIDKRQFKSNSSTTTIQEARQDPIIKALSSDSLDNQTCNKSTFCDNHSNQQNSFGMPLMLPTLECFSPQGYSNYQSQSDGNLPKKCDTELPGSGSNDVAIKSNIFKPSEKSRSMVQPQETSNDKPEKEANVRLCKVFYNDIIGRSIDLSLFCSYEEFFGRLSHMFGKEISPLHSLLFYDRPDGIQRSVGEEPYKDFMKATKIYIFTSYQH
ncbi:hypothetical protein AMTRI_Chr11g155600 [Amborella trichopoda]|uniref:auxin response factor 16 n=1 Tax=Amborella trichopoda TaxID=13333 RepID=UPI0009BCDBE4|nr:auxin response factor 16 [Amborella trichopoda]XP_020524542.1 auxin response factor 16 [Amborella trichopoda]XP_020524543.1 auxin response factor 16 [Amborella trichopoda]XP_020524544.1 auxin response factor 16 [Amborella trichopoda]XP_020524545.1 auxin response factor 16 [Amborella trichopoda]|eukprot:XP_011624395.2 auxin response factor 16 [Amborella trichopoda]